MKDTTLLTDILKADEANIPISIDLLNEHHIYDLYEEAVPNLFGGLLPALKATTPPGYFPFTRNNDAGLEIPTYDFVLRLFMLQSAREQFVFAVGHLLTKRSFIPDSRAYQARNRKRRYCISVEI